MIKIRTDGTVGGTEILFGELDIAPWLTKMEWDHEGGRLVTARVSFPATVEHLPRPVQASSNYALMFGDRKEIEAPL